jgi:hypothetical protein
MAITATTLSTAVASGPSGTDYFINVASATGITAPNFTTGAGITYLFIDQELMVVTSVSGTVIGVLRGQNGTPAQPHVINSQVQIGLPADFVSVGEYVKSSLTATQIEGGINWPATFLAGSADAIPASVPGFYVVKTGSADLMTLAAPPVSAEGNIVQVWSDTAFAHTITATSLIAAGVALKTTITFPAFRGAGVMLRACNGVWHLLSGGGSATNGGPVVLT